MTKRSGSPVTDPRKVHPFFSMVANKAPREGVGTFARDAPPSLVHFHNRDVLAGTTGPQRDKKIVLALYDLDGTLIRPRSGNTFPRGKDDWVWWHDNVPKRLRADVAAGKHVIVLSNQNVRGRWLADWHAKIRLIAEAIDDVPIRVLAALERDQYRKPQTGMWEYVLRLYAQKGLLVDFQKTVYVGDAAGRPGSAFRQPDHSSADRDMARAARLTFRTPEEHFSLPLPDPLATLSPPAHERDSPELEATP